MLTCNDPWGLSCHDGLRELRHAQARPRGHRSQDGCSRYRFLEEQSGTYRNTAWTAPVKSTHNTNEWTDGTGQTTWNKHRPSHTDKPWASCIKMGCLSFMDYWEIRRSKMQFSQNAINYHHQIFKKTIWKSRKVILLGYFYQCSWWHAVCSMP